MTTERLILREFVDDDWRAVLAYQSDPLYLRYYPWEGRTEVDVQQFVAMFLEQQSEQPRRKFQFAVLLREDGQTESDGRLIGNCGLRVSIPNPHEADIGYELDSHYWGRGYATEAAREMLRLGFEGFGLHRITADCLDENTASARVLERIGMRRTAHLQDKEFFKGRWWNRILYAIHVGEWRVGP